MALELTLPWPPADGTAYEGKPVFTKGTITRLVNIYGKAGAFGAMKAAYGFVSGKIVLSKAGRQYCQRVPTLVGSRDPMRGPLQVVLDWTPPDAKPRRIHVYHRVLYQALTEAGIWADTAQIVQSADYLHPPVAPGRVRIVIDELDEPKVD